MAVIFYHGQYVRIKIGWCQINFLSKILNIFDFFRPVPKKRRVKIKSKTGIIFNNLFGWKKVLFYVADVCLIASIIFFLYLYQPIAMAYVNYWQKTDELEQKPVVTVSKILTSQPLGKSAWIKIPKIEAESKIVAEVSPFDEQEYKKALINNEVAQAKGSDWFGLGPGKMTYLFAHSTGQGLLMARNNAVFYLLDKVDNGDNFFIGDDQLTFIYEVFDKKIIRADQTEYLKYKKEDDEVVILQTCWPIGTDWKRLLVFGRRVGL